MPLSRLFTGALCTVLIASLAGRAVAVVGPRPAAPAGRGPRRRGHVGRGRPGAGHLRRQGAAALAVRGQAGHSVLADGGRAPVNRVSISTLRRRIASSSASLKYASFSWR